MSETINTTKLYKFLTDYNKNGETWAEAADTNNDSVVIKAEFKFFLEDELQGWNGLSSNQQNDLINDFFAQFDTDTSYSKIEGTNMGQKNALSSSEIDALNARLDGYKVLDDLISRIKTNVPDCLGDYKQDYIEYVENELRTALDAYLAEKTKSTEADTLAHLNGELPNIEKRGFAQYYPEAALDAIKADIEARYGYDITGDPTLRNLIKTAIQGLLDPDSIENTSIDTLKAAIDEVIKKYLDEAGVTGVVGDGGVKGLNGLQLAVLKQLVTEKLISTFKDRFKGFEDEFDAALEDFITNWFNNVIYEDADFSKLSSNDGLVAIATGFQTSEPVKKLYMLVSVYSEFAEPNEAFLQEIKGELTDKLGEEVAGMLENGTLLNAYKEILDTIIAKLRADSSAFTDTDDMKEFIKEQIMLNISKFFDFDKDDSVDDINALYDQAVDTTKTAYADNDDKNDADEKFAELKNIATEYCEVMINKGYASCVEDVFGANYKNAIQALTLPSDLEEKIADLKAAIKAAIDAENNAGGTGGAGGAGDGGEVEDQATPFEPSTYEGEYITSCNCNLATEMDDNSSASASFTASIKTEDDTVVTPVKYEIIKPNYNSTQASVSISGNTINVKTHEGCNGILKFTLQAVLLDDENNPVVVELKTFRIEVTDQTPPSEKIDTDSDSYSEVGFTEQYGDSGKVESGWDGAKNPCSNEQMGKAFKEALDVALTNIKNDINDIVTYYKKQGYDSTKCDAVASVLIAKFTNVITNAKNLTVYKVDYAYHQEDATIDGYSVFMELRDSQKGYAQLSSDNFLTIQGDVTGDPFFKVFYNRQVLVNDFVGAYNTLAEGSKMTLTAEQIQSFASISGTTAATSEKSSLLSTVKDKIESVVKKLISAGIPSEKAEASANAVKSYYDAVINAAHNTYAEYKSFGSGSNTIKYKDANGEEKSEKITYETSRWASENTAKDNAKNSAKKNTCGLGISTWKKNNSKSYTYYAISYDKVAAKWAELFNAIK